MKYRNIVKGIFQDRPNRFIAHVDIDGAIETVHVKNTGRCGELLLPGVTVILEQSDNPSRKTKYDLIAVYKEGLGLVNMDSQAPNKVVAEWLNQQTEIVYIKPEYTYGKSRLDFYYERQRTREEQGDITANAGKENTAAEMPQGSHHNRVKCLAEVKGVTLERNGIGYFPDAPTERGVRHLEELTAAVSQGYECYLIFVIQMEGVEVVFPNVETHPEFGIALEKAIHAGVKVIYLGCQVQEQELSVRQVRYQ